MKIRRPFTKFVIDARKSMGLTQEEAAELLGISTSSLQHYESDDARIHDDIASRMAMVYHDPRLAKMYCENECALGCNDEHCNFEKSPAEIMLDLLLMNPEELPEVVRTLHRIMADGIIDDTEAADRDRSMNYLDRLVKNVEALKLQVQRVDSKSRR